LSCFWLIVRFNVSLQARKFPNYGFGFILENSRSYWELFSGLGIFEKSGKKLSVTSALCFLLLQFLELFIEVYQIIE